MRPGQTFRAWIGAEQRERMERVVRHNGGAIVAAKLWPEGILITIERTDADPD